MDEPNRSQEASRYTQRRCNFQSSDGSPSFSEYQYANEPLADYVARMEEIRDTAGGYLIIAGWQLIEVFDDPEAAELASSARTEHDSKQ